MTATAEYNPLASETLESPYSEYEKLRRTAPFFWHTQMNCWVATRYRDCRNILRDNELFARDRRRAGVEVPELMQNLQSLDPPAHTPLRQALSAALREQKVTEIRERIRQKITQLFMLMNTRTEFDWVHEVAAPVALSVTADLFGVDEPPLGFYVGLSDKIARGMDSGLNSARAEFGEEGRARLAALVAQWLATAKEGGLLAELRKIGGKVDIPGHYVENSVGMIFNASYGTLFATLGNVALTLAQHPEAVEELRSHGDRKFLETAVDELIRYDGPAQGTSRLATREVTIGGTRVQPGEVVLTLLASANRDPDEFDRPEELVLDRAPNRHLAFGWGVHGCIGALFGRAVVQELIICLRDSSQLVLTGKPVRRTTATVRSMDLLPVKFA